MGLLFNILPTNNSFANIPFYYHLAMGGFMFGIVFMATDPVSAAATDKGKIVESGKHENLLGQNKIYADLWNVQVGI